VRPLTPFELNNLRELTERSIEVALIEPTLTGLDKSIMDATEPVRNYLLTSGTHDYSLQKQGEADKVALPTTLITEDREIASIASLYRPLTKKGDPRIWFRALKQITKANDILAILSFKGELYVFNISALSLADLLNRPQSHHLKDLFFEVVRAKSGNAEELLEKLQAIADRGPIPSMVDADTSVGRTLETLLGISINSSKSPDYKGIELKAFRQNKGTRQSKNRKNLFAQVPDWNISKLKSSSEILNTFGYQRGKDFKLYCTVSALNYNSQGLRLFLDAEKKILFETSQNPAYSNFVSWQLDKLHERLIEKHNETFWIGAESIYIDGKEHFQYTRVSHTRKPIVSQFDVALNQGIITLDHLIKKNESKVVEKGPLFKIESGGLGLIFPPAVMYNLY
jgi:hypothetical protein